MYLNRRRERTDRVGDLPHFVNGVAVPISHFTVDREVFDVSGKRKVGGRYPASACLDRSVTVRYINEHEPWWTWYAYEATLNHADSRISFDPSLFRDYAYDHTPWNLTALAQAAYDKFSDQVPEEISIGNFFLEWKEAAELIPNLAESFARLGSPTAAREGLDRLNRLRGRSKAIEREGRVVPSSLTKDLANAQLWYDFGVAPLLGDLTTLLDLSNRVKSRLAFVRSLNKRTTTVRFKRKGLYPGVPAIPPTRSITYPSDHLCVLTHAESRFNASARLKVDVDVDGLDATLRTYMGALGLNNPLGIIYNAIPFSFLMDYVLRLGDVFSRHKVQPFVGLWQVSDFCWSSTSWSSWRVTRSVRHSQFDNSLVHDENVADIVERTYRREVGLPSYSELGALISIPPTPGQAKLTLALSRGLTSI